MLRTVLFVRVEAHAAGGVLRCSSVSALPLVSGSALPLVSGSALPLVSGSALPLVSDSALPLVSASSPVLHSPLLLHSSLPLHLSLLCIRSSSETSTLAQSQLNLRPQPLLVSARLGLCFFYSTQLY